MEFVAMIGLIFVPLILLLFTGWFYVRWQNEHEDEERALQDKKRFRGCAIAARVCPIACASPRPACRCASGLRLVRNSRCSAS